MEYITFKKVDDGHYDVYFDGIRLGCVYRDKAAYSYRQWFIEGDRRETIQVYPSRTKACGFRTREHAAEELARCQSSLLIAAACK